MDAQLLHELLEKHKAGTCTAAESALLNDWYAALGNDLPDEILEEGSDASIQLTQQKLQELRAKLKPARTWRWAAAAIIGAALISGIAVFQLRKGNNRQATLAQQMSKPADHSRHIVLPDGSTVVLHADSRLVYPAAFGDTREITLEGEAYFDIKKDGKPFIIHTGNLITTVLGTAFNIRAYKDSADITVSVTRGKVKVETEDNRTLLAVLTPDQQVVYSTRTTISQQQTVKALTQVSWVRQDMIFEDESFEDIAATISKRYQVNIRFTNDALKKCRIRASFDGMESLEEVLGVLCTVRNASFQTDNDYDILIDGKGCEN